MRRYAHFSLCAVSKPSRIFDALCLTRIVYDRDRLSPPKGKRSRSSPRPPDTWRSGPPSFPVPYPTRLNSQCGEGFFWSQSGRISENFRLSVSSPCGHVRRGIDPRHRRERACRHHLLRGSADTARSSRDLKPRWSPTSSTSASPDAIITTDSGTNTSWAARFLNMRGEMKFAVSGNLATHQAK
jgi:hypothetical protein